MRSIEKQLYKITRYYGRSEFVEADSVDEVAKYVAESNKAGNTVNSVTEMNLDGSHPKVAVMKSKAYKDAIKEVSAWKISQKEAMELAKMAASIQGFGTLCSTGYHTVWKSDADDDVAIDICKEKDDDGVEYYSVYVSPLYNDCDYRYTKSLDTNELYNLILEIAQSQMKVAKEVSA